MKPKHWGGRSFPLTALWVFVAMFIALVLFLLFLRYVWLIDLNLPQIVWER